MHNLAGSQAIQWYFREIMMFGKLQRIGQEADMAYLKNHVKFHTN
jgi:hypothetical protein